MDAMLFEASMTEGKGTGNRNPHFPLNVHEPTASSVELEMIGDNSSQDQGRKSVFSRLTYVNAVGKSELGGLDFFPLPDRKSNVVAIPIELAKERAEEWTLVQVSNEASLLEYSGAECS
ncbi:hypothetical protein L6452_25958 [Arctium lappa]|uniref:Uncharacterized protein n=2 Tax=Arctium lappa TaxID=4217 RepID=A0ACB9ACM2_ARCLA|nr:hypothetical protein L6452_44754 [Arctium lappa]KAI3707438.1 hypothetical protein L6452_25955 [Arctium lappa]KAI3707439.1 hypothetical protein L6452_25958 [Arctium lappa]